MTDKSKDAPTPEAERRQDGDAVRALVQKWRDAANRIDDAEYDFPLAIRAEQYRSCANQLSFALAAQPASLPAAQDGGMLPDELDAVSAEWYSLCERAAYVERMPISGELAEAIVKTICRLNSTPNAIRGDKGAEAVVEALEWLRVEISAVDPWYRGSPTYLRDGAWMKDRADDLITQAVELFAPTQAAAKDTP